ncbi:MAG: dual specificity protein phosphatase family protein [Candidatus Bathyarchaeia archaeon]
MDERMVLPRNFSWLIESKLAGCARPESEAELNGLRSEGVRAIISLTGTPLYPEPINRLGFAYLHSHISGAPSLVQLDEIIQFIEEQSAQSNPVVVHCAEGMGRTGTILAAYLVRKGMSADNAISKVREKRPGSIQNLEQENAIRMFERTLRPK